MDPERRDGPATWGFLETIPAEHWFPAGSAVSGCGGVAPSWDASGWREPFFPHAEGQTPAKGGHRCPHCLGVAGGPPYPKSYRPARVVRRFL